LQNDIVKKEVNFSEPKEHIFETRQPDGYIIEVGQQTVTLLGSSHKYHDSIVGSIDSPRLLSELQQGV
jgi:hypothetical protein